MIKISGLNKFYNKNKSNQLHVLKNINIELPEKGMIAIFGKSGCGKTTLLNMIGGLDKSDNGSIIIDGKINSPNNDIVRNKYIGYVFQNYNLHYNSTCFDNVGDALKLCGVDDKSLIENRVNAALKNVGMEKFKKRTPDTLSGGQMQRIAIARAIVKNPAVLLADEPTGNLDAENTILIMDLLKEISEDRLVILVTHEQNLVDLYCDKVIELKDGAIVNVYDNQNTTGYNGRSHNNIYLGDLENQKFSEENITVDYYGESLNKPINIKIVNYDGKTYLKLDNESNVSILDKSSEIKLIDGSFEEKKTVKSSEHPIDMKELPPIDGKKYGKLFRFKDGLIAGFKNNFAKKKKSKKLLYWCMASFAFSIVFSFAFFGVSFRDYYEIRSMVSDDVFYVYARDEDVVDKLFNSLENGTNGVKDLMLNFNSPIYGENFAIEKIKFESSAINYNYFDSNSYWVVTKSIDELNKKNDFFGKINGLKDDEVVISTFLADKIIKDNNVGYISSYENVLNLRDTRGNTVAGIVKSDKSEIYFSKNALAKHNMANYSTYPIITDVENGTELNKGEIVLYTTSNPFGYKTGDAFTINGCDFTVSRVVTNMDYSDWFRMKQYNIEEDISKYFSKKLKEEYPEFDERYKDYYSILDDYIDENYYYYLDYYYQYLDEYLIEMSEINSDFLYWLHSVKNISEVKYIFINREDYYNAAIYKNKNGKYPRNSQFTNEAQDWISIDTLYESMLIYLNEYETYSWDNNLDCFIVIDTEDYIEVSNKIGDCSLFESNYGFYKGKEYISEDNSDNKINFWSSDFIYYKIISSDMDKTKEFIDQFRNNNLPEDSFYSYEYVYTPEDIYKSLSSDLKNEIISSLISLAFYMFIVSVCIFLIMRSSIMLRIREIGIYRAIGTSKKNMIMKFTAESIALATISILPGYILASLLVNTWTNNSSLVDSVFYYSFPMAMILLIFIYVLCILAGILPVVLLLAKSPSNILSKYDI